MPITVIGLLDKWLANMLSIDNDVVLVLYKLIVATTRQVINDHIVRTRNAPLRKRSVYAAAAAEAGLGLHIVDASRVHQLAVFDALLDREA
eukprot:CAMPEP_0180815788 /NCGR_PEP_ID=MMETSP1038_2-20121128/67810_1 /TAXON_ID=632150 /ORGANISM="Azadinium spinosum, Strain 3D9" /LENGTH=90 /DNA_ID=CAMNT_0022857579 /DNA_START=183 /DNA_END=455 /DNA_ORIENTATION=+